jgi:hypothetical protein
MGWRGVGRKGNRAAVLGESFLSFFPVRIRAEAAPVNASTGICLPHLGMEHRIKSVVTVQNSGMS